MPLVNHIATHCDNHCIGYGTVFKKKPDFCLIKFEDAFFASCIATRNNSTRLQIPSYIGFSLETFAELLTTLNPSKIISVQTDSNGNLADFEAGISKTSSLNFEKFKKVHHFFQTLKNGGVKNMKNLKQKMALFSNLRN